MMRLTMLVVLLCVTFISACTQSKPSVKAKTEDPNGVFEVNHRGKVYVLYKFNSGSRYGGTAVDVILLDVSDETTK